MTDIKHLSRITQLLVRDSEEERVRSMDADGLRVSGAPTHFAVGRVDDAAYLELGLEEPPQEVWSSLKNVKAVQTLWGAARGHKEQFAEMWRLSLHYARQMFRTVELYADDAGLAFANRCGLRYDVVHSLPSSVSGFERVWSAGKLMAAARQDEPFIHIDGDVFLRQAFPMVPFIVQNEEPWMYSEDDYRKNFSGHWDSFPNHPVVAQQKASYCFGIFGGLAYQELADCCRLALDCMYANKEGIASLVSVRNGDTLASMLVEQVWVPMLMAERGIRPVEYLPSSSNIHAEAILRRYFHAMGAKVSPFVVEDIRQLEARLLH